MVNKKSFEPICREEYRCRHGGQTCGHGAGRRGRDELREEHGSTHMCAQLANVKGLHDRGSNLAPCEDIEGWTGRGGREFQAAGDTHILVAESHCCVTGTSTTV